MRPANSPIIFLKSADCSYSGQENIGSSAKNAYVFRYVKMYDRRLFLSICKVFTPLYTEYNLVFAVGQCSRKKHARLGMMLIGILALNFEVCGHTHVGQTATLMLNPQKWKKESFRCHARLCERTNALKALGSVANYL